MPESLETFLIRRLSEIAAEERDVKETLRLLKEEEDQLFRAAAAAKITIPANVSTMLDSTASDLYPNLKRKISERTIKETVVEILKEAGRPMTALQMLPIINDRLNSDYPRSSLSPQLSRLKAEGLIELDGRNWCLAQASTETNEAAGTPSKSEPTASKSDAIQSVWKFPA